MLINRRLNHIGNISKAKALILKTGIGKISPIWESRIFEVVDQQDLSQDRLARLTAPSQIEPEQQNNEQSML
ncbi:MAG: hypothetical protein AB2705_21630 [Candidatus Thiodiazotropha sp.]